MFVYNLIKAYKQRERRSFVKPERSFVRAGMSFISSLFALYSAWIMWQTYTYQRSMGITEVSVTGLSFRIPFMIATAILGVYLLFSTLVCVLNKESLLQKAKIVEIIPVLWGLILIIFVFIHYSVSYLPSENIFVIISACALTVGLMNKAKLGADLDEKGRGMFKLSCAGAIAAMLCISYAVSNLLLLLFGFFYTGDLPIDVQLVMAALSAYLLCFTQTAVLGEKEVIKEEERKGTRFK